MQKMHLVIYKILTNLSTQIHQKKKKPCLNTLTQVHVL